MAAFLNELSWIDQFWPQLSPYIMLREEDDILIIQPNQVYKLNPTAKKLIYWLRSGKKIVDLPILDENRARDINFFFTNLQKAFTRQEHHATRIPYSFDFTRLPVLGEIAVTYRCNNRCRFCYAGCAGCEGRLDSKDLPTADIKRIIEIFAHEAKIPFFSFTGGEPLLRPDLEELLEYAHSLGLKTNLVSNGTLATRERAASLAKAGLTTAQISLEAADEKLHDWMCGRQGSWRQTVDGIKNLQQAGIFVQTNSTTIRESLTELPKLPAFLKELGVTKMSANLFIPTKRAPETAPLFVRYQEIGPFIEQMRQAAATAGVEFLWYSPVPMCLYNPLARGLGNKNCAACDGLISVDPQGNVLPCSSWDEKVGNLLQQPFAQVWFGQRAQFIKNKCFAPKVCHDCAAFTACQGACPLYWDYVGNTEEISAGVEKMGTINPHPEACK